MAFILNRPNKKSGILENKSLVVALSDNWVAPCRNAGCFLSIRKGHRKGVRK